MAGLSSSTYASLWVEHRFASLAHWMDALLGRADFTPEQALTNTPGVDPRLVPKVPMHGEDIDANLMLQLSKLGLKHGKLITKESHPELMDAWKTMSTRAGYKQPPQLIIVESKTVNAMTVSPEEVVMTTGLLKRLDMREVCAVLGHELGHATLDHKRPRVAASVIFGGLGAMVGHTLWERGAKLSKSGSSQLTTLVDEVALAGIGATLGGVAANQISVRPTEMQADLRGAAISGDPLGLVSALEKLESSRGRNPLRSALAYLRSGYPTTGERIASLKRVAAELPLVQLQPSVESHGAPKGEQPTPQIHHAVMGTRVVAPDTSLSLN